MSTSHVVIDNGSGVVKAGFSGDEVPRCILPNIVGQAKYTKCMTAESEKFYLGDALQKHRGMLKLSYPMEHGNVMDWPGMERIWSHVYTKLSIMPEEHNVLLTETPYTPLKMKELAVEAFFETHNVPGICFALQPVLALYASGNKTGVVLDSGDGCTHAVPIYEGYAVSHAMTRIDLGGRDITEHLRYHLRKGGNSFTTSSEFEIVRTMKEQMCYAAYAAGKEEDIQKAGFDRVNFKLPDGQLLSVGPERFRAPEVLFNPMLIGSECESVQEVLVNCIRKCDNDIRKPLYSNVHLAGGTTLLTGFGERLLSEARRISPKDTKIIIRSVPERKYITWVGGAILSSLASFKTACVSKQTYAEEGIRALSLY
jgi:centractin